VKFHVVPLLFSMVATLAWAAEPATPDSGWVSLFDGKSFEGWKCAGDPASFTVEDGQFVAHAVGGNAHLFYTGPVANHEFKNFHVKLDVMTTPGSNSGFYIHTQYQESGWPKKGYEIQINASHRDPKRSGGLYGIKDCFDPPVKDNVWYSQEIIVQNKRIVSKIDGQVIFDYTEPDDWSDADRRLSRGTFAIQAHDPKSTVYVKNIQVKLLDD